MSAPVSFIDRVRLVVVPTRTQILAAIAIALAVLVLSHSQPILLKIGVTQNAINATQSQFHERFDVLLRSSAASNLALVTFWALVGLVAYVICWGVYNIYIEARNEVTLTTAYANRGHWRGPYETMALKSLAAVGLALMVTSLWYGISFWVALSYQVISIPNFTNAGLALAAIAGLALQLYAVLVFIQLTFTPWYRAESFTDV